MRPLAVLLRASLAATALLIAMLVPAAQAQSPATASPAAVQAAQAVARAHWGVDPCGGSVEIAWLRLGRDVNALASWSVAAPGAYDAPHLNRDCRIELSTAARFTWAKLCTVVVHEYGHLAGHPHDETPGRLMSAVYERPVPACQPQAQAQRRSALSARWEPVAG